MKRRMIGLALILSIVLLACKREGPMGPEGLQGPDGPPGADGTGSGGADNNNVVSFTVGSNIEWQVSDGAGDSYVVWQPNTRDGSLTLPDSLKESIESGMTLVYLRSVENDYYRLPLEIGAFGDDDHETYDYVIKGSQLWLNCKTHSTGRIDLEPTYLLTSLKVIVGRPVKTGVLELTD